MFKITHMYSKKLVFHKSVRKIKNSGKESLAIFSVFYVYQSQQTKQVGYVQKAYDKSGTVKSLAAP